MKGEDQTEEFRVLLRRAGLKATNARLRILAVLSSSRDHLSVKDIEKRLCGNESPIDTVTIYRVLETFSEKAIVRRVYVEGVAACYELDTTDHHHITCTKCKRQEDIDTCLFDEERIRKAVPSFASITRHSIEYFGLCKKCGAKK